MRRRRHFRPVFITHCQVFCRRFNRKQTQNYHLFAKHIIKKVTIFESKTKSIDVLPLLTHINLEELPVRTRPNLKRMDTNSDEMRIAWRYKSQPLVDTVWTNDRHFDFGAHIDQQSLTSSDIHFLTHDICLENIQSLAKNNSNNVTRVLIDGLGSPLSPFPVKLLPEFLLKLKCLVRKLPNVLCLITLNSQLVVLSNHSYVRSRVHNIADGVIKLTAFDQKTVTPYTEYNGLFNLIKLTKLNSMNFYSVPETLDLGFQLKNLSRYLIVDKLCLPPDLSETVSRTTSSASKAHNKSLEF